MPLPMVHLSAATELANMAGQPASAAFLLGNIAPDAIHMRPDIRVGSEGDKEITHLNVPVDSDDHQRVRSMLAQQTANRALKPFAVGYAAHILVDRLWIKTMVRPFQASTPADIDDQGRRNLYYRETDQVDCNLYQQMPWRSAVWEQLWRATSPDFQPLLSAAEIEAWKVRTLNWYDDPAHDPHITPQYLTSEKVIAFIHTAAQHLYSQFSDWGLGGVV